MKYKNTYWFTIIEVIIASFFLALIFTWLFEGMSVISTYVSSSNIKLWAMNIAKSGIEKIDMYRTHVYMSTSWDKWGTFLLDLKPWYYAFSGSNIKPDLKSEDDIVNFANWEWPLDSSGSGKINTDWVSYYRILKIADYDMSGSTNNLSIFDCNIKDNFCNTNTSKKILSHPYLSGVTLLSNQLQLEFSTGKIFDTKSLFINYVWTGTSASWTLSMNTNISFSSGILENIWTVWYLDFSWSSSTASLVWSHLTLSWSEGLKTTFVFWTGVVWEIGVPIWDSIDTAIFNLKIAIASNMDNFIAFIFYPNKCMFWDLLSLYDPISETKNNIKVDMWNNCNNISSVSNQNILTLSWTFTNSLQNKITLNPTYKLKLNLDNSPNDYTLFSHLFSPRVSNYGVTVENGKGYSSVYILWVKVIWVENGKIISEEIFQSYIADL